MTAFLQACLYIFLAYWVWGETGPVTAFLFLLITAEVSMQAKKLKDLAGAHNAGIATQQYELQNYNPKHDVSRE